MTTFTKSHLAFPKSEARPKKPRKAMKRSWIRRRRPRRLDSPQSDPARLAWVREQVCVGRTHFGTFERGCLLHACTGRIEACHEGKKPGMAMKCPDAETMPMCSGLHGQWTDHRGTFAGWTKEQRRTWADERIAETTARYLSHGNRRTR